MHTDSHSTDQNTGNQKTENDTEYKVSFLLMFPAQTDNMQRLCFRRHVPVNMNDSSIFKQMSVRIGKTADGTCKCLFVQIMFHLIFHIKQLFPFVFFHVISSP